MEAVDSTEVNISMERITASIVSSGEYAYETVTHLLHYIIYEIRKNGHMYSLEKKTNWEKKVL